MKKFWIIWKEGCNPNPSYKHDSLYDAEVECERLARIYCGRYYIMEAVGGAEKNDITRIVIDRVPGDKNAPF